MTAPKLSDTSSSQPEHPAAVEPASSPPGQPATVVPLALPKKRRFMRLPWLAGLLGLVVIAVLFIKWWSFRLTHSITDDAFVEADIVNIAAQSVSGHLDRFLVEENDSSRARPSVGGDRPGSLPRPGKYRQEQGRHGAGGTAPTGGGTRPAQARGSDSHRHRSPAHWRPRRPTQGRAQESVKLTEDEVAKGIDEAAAGLEAAKADLVLAEQEYTRFTNLQKEAAVPCGAPGSDAGPRLSRGAPQIGRGEARQGAQADRTQIDVAKRTLEAAEKTTQKAEKAVDLAQTGYAEIHEVELLTAVKQEDVEDAKRALAAAEDNLSFTQIRAPFPGVVVKRYRHLGDFASAGVPILSMYNPDLLYVTANLEETRLQRRRPGQPSGIAGRRLRRAVPRPRRLDRQIDRGPVRPDAAERRLRRVHQGRATRAGSNRDREGRALAAASRRAFGSDRDRATAPATRTGRSKPPAKWPTLPARYNRAKE